MESEGFEPKQESNGSPAQQGSPVGDGAVRHPEISPRPVRTWIKALAVFYGLSVIAAVFLMARGGAPPGEDVAGRLSQVSGLLSAKKDGIGWISIHGPIYGSDSSRPWEKGARQWVRAIRLMGAKKEVKAIVLDINSPGGSVGAVQEIYAAIKKVRIETKKPFVALFGDVAASGGYYIAAACDKIVAHPGTLTGSIGVIFRIGNVEGLFKKIGIKTEPIKSGRYKDIGSYTRAMTKDERKILQGVIDDVYSQFLEAVSEGRSIPQDKLGIIADGRIFTGRQALEMKMVDMLGSSQDAADLAGELGGIGKNPKIIGSGKTWDQIFSILDYKFGGTFNSAAISHVLRPLSSPGPEYLYMGAGI